MLLYRTRKVRINNAVPDSILSIVLQISHKVLQNITMLSNLQYAILIACSLENLYWLWCYSKSH